MELSSSSIRRCAIYTRKSSEEGLQQDFNSLHAQREACEAFIRSQAGEGWRLIKTAYDDGGLSGGSMERPGLQRLLADIGERLVDVVVVYKVDRLTRSLADFAKMVEVFDAHGVSFVAVTQQFNTTTSMGRLTLNVLLSFAQFEREVTGERIRDKIAASKKKGIWMGGNVPLGYDWCDRRLVINQAEAETVRHIFEGYLKLHSVRLLQEELARDGTVSKVRVSRKGSRSGGQPFGRGALYELLANPIYLGEIRHKQLRHPGQHEAIVDRAQWEEAQRQLESRASRARGQSAPVRPGPLAGRLFDEQRQSLYVSAASKGARRYRYYVSRNLIRGSAQDRGWRLAAEELERTVALAARQMLMERPALSEILLQAGASVAGLKSALEAAEARTKQLEHPSESTLAIDELVERVDLRKDGIELTLDLGGLIDQPCKTPVKMTPLYTGRHEAAWS
jgi:site-specific DNA recombinase